MRLSFFYSCGRLIELLPSGKTMPLTFTIVGQIVMYSKIFNPTPVAAAATKNTAALVADDVNQSKITTAVNSKGVAIEVEVTPASDIFLNRKTLGEQSKSIIRDNECLMASDDVIAMRGSNLMPHKRRRP